MELTYTPTRALALTLAILAGYWALYPVVAYDLIDYLYPWLQDIQASDGIDVFGTPFTNYTAGYVTFLWAWNFASPILGDVFIIKLAALSGTAICALGFWLCLNAAGIRGGARVMGTLLFVALPSVAMNAGALGQADAFYTGFVLLSLAAILRGCNLWAGLAFCVAVSFKLQAIFVAPFLAGIMLRDIRATLLSAAALIPVYLATNGLYLAGGRSIGDVLRIYAEQSSTYDQLWMGAANFWRMPQELLPDIVYRKNYGVIVLTGLAAATSAGVAILVAVFRARPQTPDAILRWATLSSLAMPFILPKMHDRYFFMAEVLIVLLAIVDRRFWTSALFIHSSAIFAYCQYYDVLGLRALLGRDVVPTIALILMLAGLASFIKAWRQEAAPETKKAPALAPGLS